MSKRVLAFGTHPDDVEFMCAGTLSLLAEKGWEIHIATMAGGQVGSATLSPDEICRVRLAEAANAASVLNGHFHYAGGYDLEVEYNSEYRRQAVSVVRKVDPDIVLSPPPSDYLIDHEETSRLVRNAAFIASVPHYDCGTDSKPASKIPHLYYWNASGLVDPFGRDIPIQFYVDVSSVLATKRTMLACHESQRQWLKYINGVDDYLETMEDMTSQQGKACGCEFAEGFIQHLGMGHPQDNILEQELQGICRRA